MHKAASVSTVVPWVVRRDPGWTSNRARGGAVVCSLICAGASLAGTSNAQQAADFRIPIEYSLAAAGRALVDADFDADGDVDVAVITEDSALAMGWNDGTGALTIDVVDVLVPVGTVSGHTTTGARSGDFNGDGFEDVLFYTSGYPEPAGRVGCLAALLFNRGDGAFTAAPLLSARPNTPEVNIAACSGMDVDDYNADGALDFVLAYTSLPYDTVGGLWGAFNVFLGDGTGAFAAPTVNALSSDATPWVSFALTSGDLNGDDVTDLVFGEDVVYFSGAVDHRVEVWSGDGTGAFASTHQASIAARGATITEVRVQDHTGDSLVDVLVGTNGMLTAFDGWELPVFLLAGIGHGTLAGPVEVGRAVDVLGLHALDFDLNGVSELAAVSRSGVTFLSSGVHVEAHKRLYSLDDMRASIATDLNADGRADLVLVEFNEPVLSLVFSDALGMQAPVVTPIAASGDRAYIETADFNRDGITDVLSSDYGGVHLLLGNVNGEYTTGAQLGAGVAPMPLLVGHVNADQNLDVVLPNKEGGFTAVLGTADGTFGGATILGDGRQYWAATLGDLDGDGDLDLAAFELTVIEPAVDIFLNDGVGGFSLSESIQVSTVVAELRILDTDLDGAQDLFIGSSTAQYTVNEEGLLPGDSWILLGNGAGAFEGLRTWPVASSSFDFADVNVDGVTDLATNTSIALGDGFGSFGAPTLVNPTSQALTFADFNSDGLADLVSLQSDSVAVLTGKGDGTFTQAINVLSVSAFDAAAADFDIDGLPDVYALQPWYDSSTGAANVELVVTLNDTTLATEPEPPSSNCWKRGRGWGLGSRRWRHSYGREQHLHAPRRSWPTFHFAR